MRRDLTIIAVAMIMILAMVSLPCHLAAQEKYTDFRGQKFTPDDLGRALFPANQPEEAEPVRTRGFTPQPPSPRPSSAKTVVALDVRFDSNSATILGQHSADLDKLGQMLTQSQYETHRVQIEGHTDSVGGNVYNQRLSERRAESIKNYLVQRFPITPERLIAKGHGESRPRSANDTDEGRNQNRRVEVRPLGKEM